MSLFVSLDIEALGVNSLDCPIIQFGAVLANWKTQQTISEIEVLVRHSSYDNCEPYAMAMHASLLYRIDKGEGIHIKNLAREVHLWLEQFGVTTHSLDGQKINVAGKNVAGFDLPRLRHQCEDWDTYVPTRQRVLDPGGLYWKPMLDTELPDLQTCLKRAGLQGEVKHTALSDARDVVKLIFHHARNS